MFRRFTFLVITFFAFSGSIGWAQILPSLPNASGSMIAPTASVSGSAKMSAIPINYYTGLPQVSSPVYNYKGPSLHLGISLDYFAGGVKVQEQATNVGLGWTLQAGGVIIRTVRGIPDDYPQAGFMYQAPVSGEPDNAKKEALYKGTLDAIGDIFMFSINGRAGKFYIGRNQEIVVVPDAKIKVKAYKGTIPDAPASTITAFDIITEDGITYKFEERELSKVIDYGTDIPAYFNKNYVSAWYLTKIVAPFGIENIRLQYETANGTNITYLPDVTIRDEQGKYLSSKYNQTKSVSIATKRITSIEFPNNSQLIFRYDNQLRCDARWDKALRQIELIKDKLLWGLKLDYIYSTPDGFIPYQSNCTVNEEEARLILQQTTSYTSTSEFPPTIYQYEKDILLPPRGSRAIDYWGYYNGKNNETITPDVPLGNRNPDFYYMRAGVLTGIKHPSGGFSSFIYEPNEKIGVDQSKELLQLNVNGVQEEKVAFSRIVTNKTSLNLYFYRENPFPSISGVEGIAAEFSILSENGSTVYYQKTYPLPELRAGKEIDISNFTNGTYLLRLRIIGFAGGVASYYFGVQYTKETLLDAKKIVGGLRIKKLITGDGMNPVNNVATTFRYVKEDGTGSGYDIGMPGYVYHTGVSYKDKYYGINVVTSDPISNLNYTQGNSIGYDRVEVINGTEENNKGKTIYEYTSFKDLSDGWFESWVTKWFDYPFVQRDRPDWALGMPLRVTAINENGKKIYKTEHFYHSANKENTTPSFRYLTAGISHEIADDKNPDKRTNVYVYKEHFPLTGQFIHDSSTVTTYFEDGRNQQKTTRFIYDSSHLTIRKINSDYDKMRGIKQEKTIYYPFDYSLGGGIGGLRDADILIPIASESWLVGNNFNKMYAAEATDFQILENKVIRPARSYSLVTEAPLDKSIAGNFNPALLNRIPAYLKESTAYFGYNSKGNAVQITDVIKGISATSVLDEETQLPIATVANAALSEVAYTSFETATRGGWEYTGQMTEDEPAATGKKSYLLNTGTISKSALPEGKMYKLTFWAKGGTVTVSKGSLIKSETNVSSGWVFYEYRLSGGAPVTLSGTAKMDELRLYPVYASMTTVCTEPMFGTITTCSADNRITYYEYDALGRLQGVRDQDRNIIEWKQYEDIAPPFVNKATSKSFNKACGAGGAGSAVIYEVREGKYGSFLSQEEADNKAAADISQNGQAYANTKGACIYYNQELRQPFTRQGCSAQETGSLVYYTIAAAKYSSNVSLEDANNKAKDDANRNGQAYANTNGICEPNLVYLKFSTQNVTYFNETFPDAYQRGSKGNLVVSFFRDAACTVPVSLSNFSIELSVSQKYESVQDGQYSTNSYDSKRTYLCSGNTATLETAAYLDIRNDIRKFGHSGAEEVSENWNSNSYTYKIVSTSRYIVK